MAVTDDWVPELTFALRLRIARMEKGLSQLKAADLCGIDVETWGKWERGIHVPHDKEEVAKKVNAGIGVNTAWLALGKPGCITDNLADDALANLLVNHAA